jgi:cobalt-zinc-cadmium efflux system membrane fusion protein
MKRKNLLIVIFVSLVILLFIGGGVYLRSVKRHTNIIQKKGEEAGEHLHDEEEAHDEHIHDETEEHDEHLHDDHEEPAEHLHDEHLHDESEKHDEHLHDDHEEPAEHLHDHEEENLVRLTDAEMKNMELDIATAGPGRLQVDLRFPAEILVNADQMANVVARLTGIVRNVKKNLGDTVKKGEVLAVIESRELADARASFHAAQGRFNLAQSICSREERLWKKKITSEQEYLDAKQTLAEARIELESAKQKLLALGFASNFLEALPHDPDESLTEYDITAPFDGKVIKKDITIGEELKEDSVAFIIADLSTVWVDLSIYQKDLPFVREGQNMLIAAGRDIPDTKGKISYISPVINEETRTAIARIILPNPGGHWRPGLFVTAQFIGEGIPVKTLITKSAIQNLEDKTCVFIYHPGEGFEPQEITIGLTNKTHAEIISGLKAGQRYVAKGAFDLKAKIVTSTLDSHAGHGH